MATQIRATVVFTLSGDGLTIGQVANMVSQFLANSNASYVGGYNTKAELVKVVVVPPEAKPAK
jgi:hypothetical protein